MAFRKALLGAALGLGGFFAVNRLRSNGRPDVGRIIPADERTGATRIVVLGAGFGGIAAVRELNRIFYGDPNVEILLVDQHNFHLFTPLLYQVSTGLVEPDHTAYPVRSMARGRWFAFRESEVWGVDFANRQVQTDDGALPYDYLVVALGSTTNFFGIPGAGENTFTLKTLRDGIRLRNHFMDCFERAEEAHPAEDRRRALTFVVVGGGATGVELAGSLMNLIDIVMLKDYPSLLRSDVRVVLVEARDRLLPASGPSLASWARNYLEGLGVEMWLDTVVTRVTSSGIETKTGRRLEAGTIVWAAGVRANDLASNLDAERGRDGRVQVTPHLQLPGREEVYLIGDNAQFLCGDSTPLPANAPVAIRQGETAARNIAASIRGGSAEVFRWHPEGELVSLGRNAAVAEIYGIKLAGFPAWLVWRTVYLSELQGFKNRAGVILDWFFAYAFRRRETARLES